MKTQSNIPVESPQKWKEGQWLIATNKKDNGIQAEGDEGKRYEADFTIVEALTAEEAMFAFTRQAYDVVLDNKVIDNIEVKGKEAIKERPIYSQKVATTIFPALPTSGYLKKGEIYSYGNGAVMVVQDHSRTIYAPELTPALFSFYRTVTEGQEWIAGEQVAVNATRTYNAKTYKCLQAHQTQEGWEPAATSALWSEVIIVTEIPVWKQPTGAVDAYAKGAKVHFPLISSPVYESLIAANVWSPTVYPEGWKKL